MLLDELKKRKGSIIFCTGRDSLMMFLVQRKLIKMYPEKFGDIDPKRIRFAALSRRTVNESNSELLEEYLNQLGMADAQEIIIVDNGILGSTQKRLHELFPDKKFSGEYLQLVRLQSDPTGAQKRGFVFETNAKGEKVSGKIKDYKTLSFAVAEGVEPSLIKDSIGTTGFIYVQEDFWNGIFESPGLLQREADGLVQPESFREKAKQVQGDPDVIPGLDSEEDFQLLKKMAVLGILDGVRLYRRQSQLGRQPQTHEAIRNMAEWYRGIKKNDGMIDNRIMESLARKRDKKKK